MIFGVSLVLSKGMCVMTKTKLLGKTPSELKEIALSLGLPSFTGGQLAQWIYVKRVGDFSLMTNLSKAAREKLSEKYEVGITPYTLCQKSKDGTKKYLFPVECPVGKDTFEKSSVEAVMIPEADRKTLCVSSQAGCKMGCHFCMTGRQGFHGNLDAADILSQFIAIDESESLTNTVFMGMGEPLDNYDNVKRVLEVLTSDWGWGWSPKRITLSSIGVIPSLRRFLDETKCHLAISLHNPFPEERASMMPVEKAYHLNDVLSLIKEYDFTGQRRVSFEYTVFAGFNDSMRHADALVHLLKGLECRVNLIRFHKIPDFPYGTAPDIVMERFRDRLTKGGLTATIRASRGEDIAAACGLLAGEHAEKK